jgi:glycosyltransferase involved in cell wall biosynthesis
MTPESQVTLILTLHAEGLIAHATFRSVNRAAEYASLQGCNTELVIVLDRPTLDTVNYVRRFPEIDENARMLTTDFGDAGLARNVAVAAARSDYVAILDGDDLISENWIVKAYDGNRRNPAYIMHPEVSVYFDQRRKFLYHPDQESPDFEYTNMILEHYWSALVVCRRETLLDVPYTGTPRTSGFGWEDWHWSCETTGRGYIHKVVPATAHFIRSKETGSRSIGQQSESAFMRHSSLFDEFRLHRK